LASTVHERIDAERIARAKSLLAETRLPMSEVAERSGYKSPAALSVAFRRALATTPTTYRRKNRTQRRQDD
jgi:AraC family transcriptional regulator